MYRTILVHADAEPGAVLRIRLAADLARRFDAKLIGVCAGLTRQTKELMTADMMDTGARGPDRDEIAQDFKLAEQQFRTVVAEAGVKFDWRALEASATTGLASAASAADLIVIGRPRPGLVDDESRAVNPAGVLLRVGRPLLIAPSGASAVAARNIVVAWKDNREGRRAMADALPFLKRAEAVTIVAIREIGEAQPLADPAAFLAAHGINYRLEAIDSDATTIKHQLIAYTERTQADLLVAGGYSDLRIGEWLFSGTTRGLIESFPVACLMSH